MIDVLRIAHLRIAPQEGNLEVGNCEGNHKKMFDLVKFNQVMLMIIQMIQLEKKTNKLANTRSQKPLRPA